MEGGWKYVTLREFSGLRKGCCREAVRKGAKVGFWSSGVYMGAGKGKIRVKWGENWGFGIVAVYVA